jgi:hypothetical protein
MKTKIQVSLPVRYRPFPIRPPTTTVANTDHQLLSIPSMLWALVVEFTGARGIRPLMNSSKAFRQYFLWLGMDNGGYRFWADQVTKWLGKVLKSQVEYVTLSHSYFDRAMEDLYSMGIFDNGYKFTMEHARKMWRQEQDDAVKLVNFFVDRNQNIVADSFVSRAFGKLMRKNCGPNRRAFMTCCYLEKHVCGKCSAISIFLKTCEECGIHGCEGCMCTHMTNDGYPETRYEDASKCSYCKRVVCNSCV